jgi:hypothetical protein
VQAAAAYFEQELERRERDAEKACWRLAERFDAFCSSTEGREQAISPSRAIRDVFIPTNDTAVRPIGVPVYTTDAPYPNSGAEIQFVRHGQEAASPVALHLTFTGHHFHTQQGERWITEVLRNYRPTRGKPLTENDLTFVAFVERHERPYNWPKLWEEWDHEHPGEYKSWKHLKKRWDRLIKRLRRGALFVSALQHVPLLITSQGDGSYSASVLIAGCTSGGATPEAAITTALQRYKQAQQGTAL